MRYFALVTDYDGTIAHHGLVDEQTLAMLRRLRQGGRKIVLVTGRELPDLERVFPHLDVFDRLVVENGAVLFDPKTREKRILAPRPPDKFVAELRARGVTGLSVGDVIVATWHPHEMTVLETIRDFGLDLQVIFNKDAVMVLPAGVNKTSGLHHALADLKLSRHNVVGVGDAENDLAFLKCCECSVAVANALQAVKDAADFVTEADHGAGVQSLVTRMMEDDLRSLPLSLPKHGILFGRSGDRDIHIDGQGKSVLLCGQSGGGKSTFVAGLVERIAASEYQVCVMDPEGDYEKMAGFLTLGNQERPPSFEEIFQVLEDPRAQLIVNLVGLKMPDRPGFFASLLTKMHEKRMQHGRPHWIVIDEAHHLLPSGWAPATAEFASRMASLLLVTVHPKHVSPAALRLVDVLTVIGNEPQQSAEEFASALGIETPAFPSANLNSGEAAVWFRDTNEMIERMQSVPGKAERKRHRRKYAEGELEPERVFYFHGPEGKMNLRAQNLAMFIQLATGIDDDTWLFHLRRGDYSGWLASGIKDPELAEEIRRVEQERSLSAAGSREKIVQAIEAKYTAPA
jgi:HAD superfamily hydrolase (TIGR01484 family)